MNRLSFYIILLSFSSLIYLILAIEEVRFLTFSFLPTLLLILTVAFKRVYTDFSNSIVFKFFILQVCIRYCLLPIIIIIDHNFGIRNEVEYLNIALMVMALELISSFLVFWFFSQRQKNSYSNKKTSIKSFENHMLLLFIIIIMLIYLYSVNTFEKINLVWSLGDYVERYVTGDEEIQSNSLGTILFTPFKIISALCFISFVYKNNKIQESRKKWLYLIIILISSMFIVGTSRFSIVLFSLPLLVLVSGLVNKKDSNTIVGLSILSILSAISITTIAKFSRYGNDGDIGSVLSAFSINAYFAGPGNITIGFKASEGINYYDSLMYLVNDTFQNVPILSNLTTGNYKLTSTFNQQIYGHQTYADQIAPLSISGLFHFGIIGVFIYSSFFLSVALYFERKSYRVETIGYKYILIYLSITLSLVFMLNLGSFYAVLARSFLFLFIPFFIINKFLQLKRR